jgi:uncharacterized protein YjbJ (UPF0337 family)
MGPRTRKGGCRQSEGAIKDTAGNATETSRLQTEGTIDKAKGGAHNIAGDVKDAVSQSWRINEAIRPQKSRLMAVFL